MNQIKFRENCLCNIHSDCIVCIRFSRKAALAAYWGRGVDLVLFLGESAETKLILKRYVRGIVIIYIKRPTARLVELRSILSLR